MVIIHSPVSTAARTHATISFPRQSWWQKTLDWIHNIPAVWSQAHVWACAEDPEVVGVLAQLATVDDTALSEVLATTYRALLPVLVVQSSACTHRLNHLLAQAHQPVPDILSLSHSQPFK